VQIACNSLRRCLVAGRVGVVLLSLCAAVACSSTSDPGGGAGGLAGASLGGSTGTGGNPGSGGGGGGASGSAAVAGNGGHSGGAGGAAGAPTQADAVAAIQKTCATALKQCPQLNVSRCESDNAATLPSETSPCFSYGVAFFECAAKLPASDFECYQDQTNLLPQLCKTEADAERACRSPDAGM